LYPICIQTFLNLVIENFHGPLQYPLRGEEIVPPLEGRGTDEFPHNISQTHFKNPFQKQKPKQKPKNYFGINFHIFFEGVGNIIFSNQNDKVDTKYFSNPFQKPNTSGPRGRSAAPPGRVDQHLSKNLCIQL